MILSKEEKTLLISALIYLKFPEIDCEIDFEGLKTIPELVRKIQDGEKLELPLYYFDVFPVDLSDNLLRDLNIPCLSSKEMFGEDCETV